MSRSYKKTPIWKDRGTGKPGKQWANRTVRNYKSIISNGSSYKKLFCKWDIHDWVSRQTLDEVIALFESDMKRSLREDDYWKGIPKWDEVYSNWAKWHLRK